MSKETKAPAAKAAKAASKAVAEVVAILWTFAFIVFLRVYILEPYVIPSESMVPTLLVGDHVFVARGAYDFRLPWPFPKTSLLKVSDPKRGDVVVFDYPIEDSEDAGKFFVKRVIGLPGDSVEVHAGVPIVNGKAFDQKEVNVDEASKEIKGFKLERENTLYREAIPDARESFHWTHRINAKLDRLDEVKAYYKEQYGKDCVKIADPEDHHPIMINEICPFHVPPDNYFVMGDNRDNSSDGRVFGFVPRNLIKGRVMFIWFSPPPGEVNPYKSSWGWFAAIIDMVPGFFRMFKDHDRLSRVGDPIH